MSRWNQIQDLSESLENVPGASCASIAFLHYLHIYSNTNNQSYYVLGKPSLKKQVVLLQSQAQKY